MRTFLVAVVLVVGGCYSAHDVVPCDVVYMRGDRTIYAADASEIDGDVQVCSSADCRSVIHFDLSAGLTICDVIDPGDNRPVFDTLIVH